jgi:hypothetical protein
LISNQKTINLGTNWTFLLMFKCFVNTGSAKWVATFMQAFLVCEVAQTNSAFIITGATWIGSCFFIWKSNKYKNIGALTHIIWFVIGFRKTKLSMSMTRSSVQNLFYNHRTWSYAKMYGSIDLMHNDVTMHATVLCRLLVAVQASPSPCMCLQRLTLPQSLTLLLTQRTMGMPRGVLLGTVESCVEKLAE